MLRGRSGGLKRKRPADDDEDRSYEYRTNLSNFQIAAKHRESLRLKHSTLSNAQAAPGTLEQGLKERINLEMSMIEGTAKFIMACKNRRQTVEAAKALLLSRLRSDMLKYELSKLRRGRGSPQTKEGKPSYASLSISDLRIPLMWRRKDHIDDTGDPRRYAVFCVARIGSQIYDSTLVADPPVDRHSTDITFPDVLLFHRVPAHFELIIEIYSHRLEKELGSGSLIQSVSSTPQKLARSISRAVGKSLMSKAMKDFENIGPKFELVASATLTLEQCSEDVKSHELYLENPDCTHHETDGSLGLPLFGYFCCRLAAKPYCREEVVISGNVNIKRPDLRPGVHSAESVAREMFAALLDWKLALWTNSSQKDAARAPALEIPINRGTRIEDIGSDTLRISNSEKLSWEFYFRDKENLHHWLVHLLQHASDHRRWKQAATERMDVLSPKNVARDPTTRTLKRTRSNLVRLYDEVGNWDEEL